MNEPLPLVSVCIPTYNAQVTIRETLDSIMHQSYRNLEVLVFDNASTDRTLEIVKLFDDPRIVVYESETNIGAEANFTRCIQQARGKYTAIYHADDIYGIKMVEKQTAYLESHPAVGAVFTEANLVDENSRVVGASGVPHTLGSGTNSVELDFQTLVKAVLLHSNFLICPSAMLRTSIYQGEIGHWRYDLFGSSSDLDVWLRVAENHRIGILREPLLRYRISVTQFTHVHNRMRTSRAPFFQVMDYYLEKAAPMLDSNDHRHYGWLERADRTIRAMNLFLDGQNIQANELLQDLFSSDAFLAALSSVRGLKAFLLGGFIKLTIMLHLYAAGRSVIIKVRGIARK